VYQALQGNVGLGKAIEYFTSHSIPVCIPLNDTQKYDLVVDMDGKLQRISVKTSRFMDSKSSYYVLLKNCGGSSGKGKIRHFDNTTCDYVFVLTGNNKMYLIPAKEIAAKSAICIGNKYTEYEVFSKIFDEFENN
jgi:hypothetical protein